jgi:hypothetical protein
VQLSRSFLDHYATVFYDVVAATVLDDRSSPANIRRQIAESYAEAAKHQPRSPPDDDHGETSKYMEWVKKQEAVRKEELGRWRRAAAERAAQKALHASGTEPSAGPMSKRRKTDTA